MSETLFKAEYRHANEPLPEETPEHGAEDRVERERAVAKLRLLWERRGFLLRLTAIGLLSATLLAFLIPARYTSTTRLMPPENQSTQGLAMLATLAGKAPPGLASLGGELLGIKNTGDLFVGVLSSRTVQDALIAKFDLQKVYWDGRLEDARKDLAERTGLSADRKSGIITITVTDRSPQRAAAMAQEYVGQLNRVVTELNTSAAHRERIFLEERLKGVKKDLEESEEEFGQFASKNAALDIKEQARTMVQAAATLQGQLIAAQSELEGLRQIYTENNVRVRATEARIAELRLELNKLGGREAAAGAAPGQTQTGGEPLYPSIRKLPLLGVQFADLYRRTKVQEAIFETLTQTYELAKVEEAKETPTVKVLDLADVPGRKSFPPRLLIILLGSLLALFGGVGWELAKARWNETDPGDPRKMFAQEVFSAVITDLGSLSANGNRLGAFGRGIRIFIPSRWISRNDGRPAAPMAPDSPSGLASPKKDDQREDG